MKFFAVWVVLGGVAAYIKPNLFLWLKDYNQHFFALTMFGIGAVLSVEDFVRIAKRPYIVFVGSAAQFIIMPLGAFALTRAFGLAPEYAIGLIIAGSAPGAMASNVMCYIAKADTAYSVSLTTVSTLLCPVLTPGLTLLLASKSMDVEFLPMFKSVMLMVIVPLIFGFGVHYTFKKQVEKIKDVFAAISATFIIFICALVIAMNKGHLKSAGFGLTLVTILAVVVLLNLYGTGMGYLTGKLFRLSIPRRRTLAIEIGMQNAGLGTVLAVKHFDKKAAIPTAFFVFVCIITASILSEIWRRRPLEGQENEQPGNN